MDFKPIGFVSSWFTVKNGTPRQGGISALTRGSIKILDSVFNNPGHSLDGLQEFSHVWIVWVFSQNSGSYTKAKIAPPRLGGKRVGVFSTRTPHRPNPIGLTLAKLEKIEGSTIHLSGLDLLDGTPILDIKPFIPDYDTAEGLHARECYINDEKALSQSEAEKDQKDSRSDQKKDENDQSEAGKILDQLETPTSTSVDSDWLVNESSVSEMEPSEMMNEVSSEINRNVLLSENEKCNSATSESRRDFSPSNSEQENLSRSLTKSVYQEDEKNRGANVTQGGSTVYEPAKIASWLKTRNEVKIPVRFTPAAISQLNNFSSVADDDSYRFGLLESTTEAEKAIADILSEDPRSIYRKNKCVDRLYFVMVDSMHVTAWYDDESGIFEVVRIMPKALRNKS